MSFPRWNSSKKKCLKLSSFSSWNNNSFLSLTKLFGLKFIRNIREDGIFPLQDEKPSQGFFCHINDEKTSRYARQGRFPFPLAPVGADNWQIKVARDISQDRHQRLTLLRAISLSCASFPLLQGKSLSHPRPSSSERQKNDPAYFQSLVKGKAREELWSFCCC